MKPQRPNALHGRVAAVHKCRRSLRRPLFFPTSNFKGHLRDYSSSGRTNSLHRRELGAGSDHISQNCGVGDPGRHASGCIHHTPYTKAKETSGERKKIYTYRCAFISAAATTWQKETFRRTRHATRDAPVSNNRGATPGPPYYERTLSACAMSRTDAQRAGRPGRATERTTAQRTGALLPPLAPLAASAEIKTMATLRLRDRREKMTSFCEGRKPLYHKQCDRTTPPPPSHTPPVGPGTVEMAMYRQAMTNRHFPQPENGSGLHSNHVILHPQSATGRHRTLIPYPSQLHD